MQTTLFGFFLGLVLAVSTSTSALVREARIEGSQQTVSLYFNPQIEQMMALFTAWENDLKTKGIPVRFYLSAGEFRRAVLHAEADGPGDVEILIHVLNESFRPLTVGQVLGFLKSHGVLVEEGMHRIFGPDKKLDFFVKDKFALDRQLPYMNNLGPFAGMGDTSLNELRYSASENVIDGHPDNRLALARRQIRFLDQHKTERRPPRKVVHVKATTEYNPSLLRVALRSIRLETEILLAPNPNHLVPDESFSQVRNGFDLYFAATPEDQLGLFEMDPTYLEQFLKIFRGRTLKQRQLILSDLETNHSKTLWYFKQLNLDYELLAKGVQPGESEHQLEIKAILNHARYEYIRPFFDSRRGVLNPFSAQTRQKKLLALAANGRPPHLDRMIPEKILSQLSPHLAYLVNHFKDLDLEHQTLAVKDYVDLLKLLAKPAQSRLIKQKEFLNTYFRHVPFIDPSHLAEKDPRSLLEFLEVEWKDQVVTTNYRWARVESSDKAFSDLLVAAKAVSAEGFRPVLAIDLDGVLFEMHWRDLAVLKEFDSLNNTSYFRDTSVQDLERHSSLTEFLFHWLPAQISDPKALVKLAAEAKEFVEKNLWSENLNFQEHANEDLIRRLQSLFQAGVHPIFITGRSHFMAERTRQDLSRMGFGQAEVFFDTHEEKSTRQYKSATLHQYIVEHPGHKVIGFLDDLSTNVNGIAETFPDILSFVVHSRRQGDQVETFLSRDAKDIFSIFGVSSLEVDCGRLLEKPASKAVAKKKK